MDEDNFLHARVPSSVKRGLEAVVARNREICREPTTLAAALTEACNTWLLRELPGYEVATGDDTRSEVIPLQILRGIARFIANDLDKSFRRVDIRDEIGVDPHIWTASFSPIFQAMRQDQPGGAPLIGGKYRGLIRRIGHGLYVLTSQGRERLTQLAR